MDGYTVASIGPHIVLLNAKKRSILFSKKPYNFISAGETIIDGKKYIISYFGNNFVKSTPLDSLSLADDFTAVKPNDIIKIMGENDVCVKIKENRYVDLGKTCDLFIYRRKAYETQDYSMLNESSYNKADNDDFGDGFAYIPLNKKFIDDFNFASDSSIKLQIFFRNEEMYFISGNYIEFDHHNIFSIIMHEINDSNPDKKYFLSIESNVLFLEDINNSGHKIKLTKNIEEAARPANFSGIYKFPEPVTLIAGKHKYGNIIINSSISTEKPISLYSTVSNELSKEFVFCIYLGSIFTFDYSYVTPTNTKAALRE